MRKTIHRLIGMILPAAVLVLVAGCSIQMQHDPLIEPTQLRNAQVNVAPRAENIVPNRRVGWGRFTVFAIPVVPVHVRGDASELLVKEVQAALQQAGYTVSTAASTNAFAQSGSPVTLNVKVEKYRFSNYTYFFPLVPTWGTTHISLNVDAADGTTIWQESFAEGGSTLNFFDGYTIASRKSVTRVLNRMVTAFGSDEFFMAVTDPAALQAHRLQTLLDGLSAQAPRDTRSALDTILGQSTVDPLVVAKASARLEAEYQQHYQHKSDKLAVRDMCQVVVNSADAAYREQMKRVADNARHVEVSLCAKRMR